MSMTKRAWTSFAAMAFLAACGGTPPTTTENDTGVTVPVDTGTAATCGNHIPNPSAGDPDYGTLVGRSFREFSSALSDCNGGSHTFYDSDFCDSTTTYTVVSIAAGWCHPCQMESAILTDNVVSVYGPHGVRVIQLLVQDPNYQQPNAAFCNQWVSTYGLSVVPDGAGFGNYELLDPAQVSNVYFPDGALPSTLIIDNHGVIRFHENGASESLASLTSELDRLLGL
jgi:hypothetical protein